MGILRLWLAVVVLLFHAPDGVISLPLYGHNAVKAFFVISGFYMQLVIPAYAGGKKGWVLKFYLSRALRIFPLYWLFMILSTICLALTKEQTLLANHYGYDILTSGHIGTIFIYAWMNIALLGQEILRFMIYDPVGQQFHFGYCHPTFMLNCGPNLAIVMQAWSLSLEIGFYLVAPFLLPLRTIWLVMATLGSLALLELYSSKGHGILLPMQLHLFILGALSCRFYRARLTQPLKGPMPALAALAILLAIVFWDLGFMTLPYGHSLQYSLYIGLVVIGLPMIFAVFKDNALDRFLGDMCYPVYVSHWLVIAMLTYGNIPGEYIGVLTLAICLVAAVPLIRYVEQPIDRRRHRWRARHPGI